MRRTAGTKLVPPVRKTRSTCWGGGGGVEESVDGGGDLGELGGDPLFEVGAGDGGAEFEGAGSGPAKMKGAVSAVERAVLVRWTAWWSW